MRLKLALVIIALAGCMYAQQPEAAPQQGPPQGPGGRRGMGMQRRGTGGTITEIKGDTLTLKDMQGTTVTVKLTPSTEYRKDGQQAKLSDFKTGDMVMVRGESTGENTWTATGVMANQGAAMMREQLGKKFIAGEVTKIEDTKLTIKRIDGESQVIEVDENTSFRNAKRESVTLADIKVGDRVMGRGDLKDGTFVPAVLNVGAPGDVMRRPGGPGGPPPRDGDKPPEKPE